ncbi:MAG: vWA domain-containing protein [Limisphaerales bacterium]
MKRFFAALPLLLAALFLAAPPCPADAAPRNAKHSESRFLFIVDTSAAMRGCSNASVQSVAELLDSDMKGEIRKGDTIGLWTYDEKLSTEYPMQVWSTEDKSAILDEMAAYLRGRRYGKRAHLENVMPALNQVIKNSERLTVILISDGSGLIQGTPFDREINLLQKKYARELRSAHEPFVTVLAVRDGAVFDYIINYPGWVAIPHIARPEPPVETNAPVVAAAPIPRTNAPPLSRPTRSFIMSARTNAPHAAAPPPATVAPPVKPPAPPPPTVVVAPVPAPAPVVAAPVPAPPPVAIAPVPAPPHVATVAPVPISQPANPAVAPPPVQPAPPPIVARQNPEPAAANPLPHAPVAVSEPHTLPAPPVARNAPVAAIAPPGGAPLALYVMAFSLLTIAVVLVVFLIRRLRRAPQPSLISQSIDRPR